ncbi:MAG: WD40 repeat domain-containing protein [Opitutus sp.]|nr:WD40 repeat domain-containing protein [Opitutus sp.]
MKHKYSADGRTLFVQGEDGVLRAIDTGAWRVLRAFAFERKLAPGGWSLADNNPLVLAVAFDDGSIQVCDAVTGAPRMPPFRPKEGKSGIRLLPTLSPDGKWLAAGTDDRLWLWDAETGEQRAMLPTYLGVVRFSPDSRRLATIVHDKQEQAGGSTTSRPQLWAIPDATPVGDPLGRGIAGFNQMEFSPDGRALLARFGPITVLFDCESGASIRPPIRFGTRSSVRGFTPDSARIIVVGDRDVRVFDVATGEVVFPPLVHGGPIIDIEVRQGGGVLFTNSVDGISRLWDLRTGALRAEATLQQPHYTPATLSPDGTRAILFSAKGQVHGFDLGRGAAQRLTLPRSPNEVQLHFLRDMPHVLLRMSTDRAMAMDVASGLEVPGGFEFPQPLSRERGPYLPIIFSPDQQTLIARLAGNVWQVWKRGPQGTVSGDIVLENLTANPAGAHPANDYVAFSGPQLAGGRSAGVWSLATGKLVAELKHESGIYGGLHQGAQMSADGRRIGFKTLDDAVHVRDFPAGTERFVLRFSGRSETYSWRFSPDGTRILTADRWGGVSFSDAADGRLVRSVQRHRARADAVDFSRDGRRVISRSDDGTAQVWDVATGSEVGALLAHDGAVTSGAFSPDGRHIVTGTIRGNVRVWETATGQPLTEPMRRGAEGSLQRIEFSPDGRFFATMGTGRQVWAMPPDGGGAPPPEWLLRLATIAAGRRLTDDGEFVEAREELGNVAAVRTEMAALPDGAPYAEWGRWLLDDSPTRSIAPGFTITPAEAEKLAKEFDGEPAAPATPAAPGRTRRGPPATPPLAPKP